MNVKKYQKITIIPDNTIRIPRRNTRQNERQKNVSMVTSEAVCISFARAAESAADMTGGGFASPGLLADGGVSSHDGTGDGFHVWKYLYIHT